MGWGKNLYELVRIPIKRPCKGYYLRWYYNGWHYWFFRPGSYSVVTEGEVYRTIGTRTLAMSSGQIDRGQAQAIRTIMNTREVYLLTIAGWMNIRLIPGSLIVHDNRHQGVEIEFVAIIGSKEISYDTGFTPVPGDGYLPEIPVVPPSTEYCERIIGTQIWMCKNWDSNYPGSKVYNNNEANRAIYGGLYSFAMVNNPGFAPAGWHVPELAEWQKLIDFIGELATAGGILKEEGIDHWDAGIDGTDDYGFAALGAGYWFDTYGYINLKKETYFWAPTDIGPNPYYIIRMTNASAAVAVHSIHPEHFNSVRLIKDTPSLDELKEMNTELFLQGVGGFNIGFYWSSTEFSNDRASGLNMAMSAVGNPLKSSTNYVRAFRSFTAGIGAYALRDVGPGGGLVFYIDGAGTTYYEAAATDQSISQAWSNIIAVAVTGTGSAIGTGYANTDLIINQAGHTDSAARICRIL